MITGLVGELTSASVRTNNESVSDTQQFRDLASAADRLSRELRWCGKVLWPASVTAQKWGEGCSFASRPDSNFNFVYQRRAADGKNPQVIGLKWNCRDKCLYRVVYKSGFKASASSLNRKDCVASERLLSRNISYIGISSLNRMARGGRLYVDLELRGASAAFSLKGGQSRGNDGGVILRTQVQVKGDE
ncbi:hypothetical protein IJT93_00705 [bacterium]|nr:hypothetical protein [bacterium]